MPTQTIPARPLRLWPGVAAAAMILVAWLVPLVVPDAMMVTVLGGVAGRLAVVVWWLCFSRAEWVERLGAVALMIAAVAVVERLVHASPASWANNENRPHDTTSPPCPPSHPPRHRTGP